MRNIKENIDKIAEETNFYGLVSISKEFEESIQLPYGYRDYPNRIKNDKDTIFPIASGTKLFTAVSICKLIEQGKLTLETKVDNIFKEHFSFIDGESTIHNLLTHTSGIYDYYDNDLVEDFSEFHLDIPWYELESPSDYLVLLIDKKMKFKANESMSYSNSGYLFLAVIIEKITGITYESFIQDNILDKVGMKHSGFYAMNQLPAKTCIGYSVKNNEYISNIYNISKKGVGDTGLYTTDQDLILFWKALLNNELLSETITNSLLKSKVQMWDNIGYGLGIYINNEKNEESYVIVGADPGIGFYSRYFPISKTIINVFSNKSDVIWDFVKSLNKLY
ncbi:MAG: beta-lactamase family protein [Spirochaetaceae bacterium]